MRWFVILAVISVCQLPQQAGAETRAVALEDGDGARTVIATLITAADGSYILTKDEASFEDHFLSMRPFRCIEGPQRNWCHVPYPYENARNIEAALTDLEYDLMFVWKDATDYGINMWNGVYSILERDGDTILGTLHELDMGLLAVPPPESDMRPLREQDLHASDPASHWLPRLIIE